MKTVAIHQPNYLPWLGFFYKIYAADHFILLDDVPYSKGSFTARTYYRKQVGSQEKGYLSVPLKKAVLGTDIKDLQIDQMQNWTQRQLNQLQNTYRSAPQFDRYFPYLQHWMEIGREMNALGDWNELLIKAICELLGMETPMSRSSELAAWGRRTAYLIELIREVNGACYLSGVGGKKYHEESLFKEAGIRLEYVNSFSKLETLRYQQEQGNWLNGLGIIDALFNIGTKGILELFNHFQDPEQV